MGFPEQALVVENPLPPTVLIASLLGSQILTNQGLYLFLQSLEVQIEQLKR